MFCTNCGKQIPEGSAFCPECGAKIGAAAETQTTQAPVAPVTQPQATTQAIDGEEAEYITAYLQGNKNNVTPEQVAHYMKSFANIKAGKSVNWNWCQFLFGGWHFIYRKSYLWGLIVLIGEAVLAKFIPFLSLILSVLCGLFGDFLIHKTYQTKLAEAKAAYQTKEEQLQALRNAGGVNKWVIGVGIAITVIYVVILILAAVLVGAAAAAAYNIDWSSLYY